MGKIYCKYCNKELDGILDVRHEIECTGNRTKWKKIRGRKKEILVCFFREGL